MHIDRTYKMSDVAAGPGGSGRAQDDRQAGAGTVTAPQPFRPPAIDFRKEKMDAFLVTGAANVRYVSGFTGSNGVVLAMPDSAILFTDPRYTIQSSKEVDCQVMVVPRGGLLPAVVKFLKKTKLRRIGFEKAHLTYQQYLTVDDALPSKARTEANGRRGAAAADGEIRGRDRRHPAVGEHEFAGVRSSAGVHQAGGDAKPTWPPKSSIRCAVWARIAPRLRPSSPAVRERRYPTPIPGSRPFGTNELVLIDMGASQGGYASDMTRVVWLGRPSKKIGKMYRAVLDAQLAGIGAVRAGVTAGSVDRATRKVLKEHGLDKAFTHSTGHGLGLEIHEPPRLGKGDKTKLEAGMTITIEPGVYIEDFGGIRIEDTVVVTANGCEVLTPTPKELIAL